MKFSYGLVEIGTYLVQKYFSIVHCLNKTYELMNLPIGIYICIPITYINNSSKKIYNFM